MMPPVQAWPPGANFNPDLNKSYYVIIGTGFAALVNHLTLRVGPGLDKTGRLPVLHIGEPDPWRLYAPVKMGQWPALLTLPGFTHRPSGTSDHAFLSSKEFADVSARQWADLSAAHPFFALNAHVTAIRESPLGGYEVHCGAELPTPIFAARVDVCGGPGPPRRLSPSIIADSVLLREYESGAGAPHRWPRIVTAEKFLQAATPLPQPRARVAVIGGGPTAAWCVERAEAHYCSVLWVADDRLNSAFIASRRNDGLAQGPLTRSRVRGSFVVDGPLYPARIGTRFAEGIHATNISLSPTGVDVAFQQNPSAIARHVDAYRTDLPIPLPQEEFDQVVVAMGQLQHSQEPGSWAQLLDSVLSGARHAGRHLILDRAGRAIGLQSHNGNLRVLGAAAFSHPDVTRECRQPSTASNIFFQSLVEQARVEVGITLSALAIAEANAHWGAQKANENLNTACLTDFDVLWPNLFSDAGRVWLEMRAARIPPFTAPELRAVLSSTRDRY